MAATKLKVSVGLILGVAGFIPFSRAQTGMGWFECRPNIYPPPRCKHSMAFDNGRNRIVLFGGYIDNNSPYANDTWEWNGITWAKQKPTTYPPGRNGHGIAYDNLRQRIVLCGGDYTNAHYLMDTWEWDGIIWAQRRPVVSPTARSQHAIAFDSARKKIVLFGGKWGGAGMADTWEWDGGNWKEIKPAVSPLGRCGHALVFDVNRKKTVLFGGFPGEGIYGSMSDTWEWDGVNWTQRFPTHSPPARYYCAMAYDPIRTLTFLFGGWYKLDIYLSDTWAWDGIDWVQCKPPISPPGRFLHSATIDPGRGVVYVFGGMDKNGFFGDMWAYTFSRGSFSGIGQGCQGSHGKTPVISSPELPRLGTTFHLDLTNALPLAGSALFLDVTNPGINLGPFGAPTCFAYTNLGLFGLVVPVTWSGTWNPSPAFPVPNDLALLGGTFFAQAFILDAKANALGAITSNGLKGVVGF